MQKLTCEQSMVVVAWKFLIYPTYNISSYRSGSRKIRNNFLSGVKISKLRKKSIWRLSCSLFRPIEFQRKSTVLFASPSLFIFCLYLFTVISLVTSLGASVEIFKETNLNVCRNNEYFSLTIRSIPYFHVWYIEFIKITVD